MLVSERPLTQAVKSFECADPIMLPFISPESKSDPVNLISRLKKCFLKGLLLVKCTMILAKPVLLSVKTKMADVDLLLFEIASALKSTVDSEFPETGAGSFHCTVCHAKRCIPGFANWLWKVSDLSSDS